MRQRRLCDNCRKVGHVSTYSHSKAKCTNVECNQKQHLLLYRDERTNAYPSKGNNNSSNDHFVDSQPNGASFLRASVVSPSGKVFSNVIPVYVEFSSKFVMMYAFLDQGSTTSLRVD